MQGKTVALDPEYIKSASREDFLRGYLFALSTVYWEIEAGKFTQFELDFYEPVDGKEGN